MSDLNLQITPAKWSYRDFNEFLRAFNAAKFREAGVLAGKIVKSWGFPQKVEGDNPLGKLPFGDAAAVVRAIPELCSKFLDGINEADFTIDLTTWTWDDFSKFNEEGMAFNLDYVETEIRRIGKVNGEPLPSGELNYIEGAMLMRKIQTEVQKVISGKN
jgi:hypothetical protein